MTALRLVVDNAKPTRESQIDSAVRAAAYWCWPFGVFNLGLRECLQKQLATGDMQEFAREVRSAWHIENCPDTRIGGHGL